MIRRFNYQPFSSFSLSNSAYITGIQEDTSGLLWVGTDECLYVFDPATERFFNLNYPLQELPRQGVTQICIDMAGTIIVHMPSKQDSVGLYHIIVPPNFSHQLRYGKEPLAGVRTEKVTAPRDIDTPVYMESFIGDTLLLVRGHDGRGYRLTGPPYRLMPFDLLRLNTPDHSILWNNNIGIYFRRRLPNGRDTLLSPNIWRRMIRLKDGSRFFNIGSHRTLYKIRSEGPLYSDSIAVSWLNQVFQHEFAPFLEFPYEVSVILNDQELLLVLHNQLEFQRIWKQRYAVFEKGLPVDAPESPVASGDTFRTDDAFMKKLYRIFEAHHTDEHFNHEQLCRLTGMSSSQLHRKLTALTDQPAMQMLRTFRLNKARALLRTRRDLQVAEICMLVGFNNPAHFSRMFSKTFGMSPSAARNETE